MAREKIRPIEIIISQLGIIVKRYLFPELVLPVTIGILVLLVSRQLYGLSAIVEASILLGVSIIIYSIISVVRLYNRSTVTVVNYNYAELIDNSKEFFCTSVIPPVLRDFEMWFSSEIVESFSFMVRKKLENPNYKACRVLIFMDRKLPMILKAMHFFDGSYARRVASIHKNSGVDLAYINFNEFIKIAKGKETKAKEYEAGQWDMAIFPGNKETKMLVADIKARREIGYNLVDDPSKMQICAEIMELLKKRIYDDTSNTVKEIYDFYRFLMT